jgi:hypothetical protein
VVIAIMGRITVAEAQQLAAARTEGSQGIALLFEVSSWLHDQAGDAAEGPQADSPRSAGSSETAKAAAALHAAGWHVSVVDAGTPLAAAWQRLPRAAEMLVPADGGRSA